MTRFTLSATISALLVSSLAGVTHAATFTDAVAWWQLEGNTNDATTTPSASNLTAALGTETGMNANGTIGYVSASSIAATDAGSQAFSFNGNTVLKSNDANLRIGGAQTFWIRVKFDTIASGTVALMARNRAATGQRGIGLQMTDGKIGAIAASVPAGDNSQVQTQAYSSLSDPLAANTWYDISLRYQPSTGTDAGLLRYDIYNPQTGQLLSSLETTTNVPSAIGTSNSIGSGYFQIGGNNNGSGGSAFIVPNGTQVEAAAVWNSYLSNGDLAQLSAVPEPASLGLLGIAVGCLLRRRR